MKDIRELIIKRNRLYRIILITISLFLGAIVYNLFLLPLGLVTGGTAGIATITHYLYEIDPSIMILLLSVSCCLIGFMYLGTERTAGTLLASIMFPVMVKLTAGINTQIMIDTRDILLVVVFAGVLNGVSNGLMYKSGYSTGGFSSISQVLYEKFQISIAKSSMIINVVIVLIGSYFFGTTNALYAIIYLYINNIVMDRVLLGISTNKAFYIMTHKEEEIKDYIINNLHHTVTVFNVKGGFLDDKRKVILTVIPSSEYYRLTEGIKEIDNEAFFVATDSYQVEGAK